MIDHDRRADSVVPFRGIDLGEPPAWMDEAPPHDALAAAASPPHRIGESRHLRPGLKPISGDYIEMEPAPSLLPIIDLGGWRGEPPTRESAWGDWLPLRQTTMLTGRGGIGKSLLEQMLLSCIALGLPFLGMATRQANVLYVTCEDDPDELWRRQAGICALLCIPIASLEGKLNIVSLCGEEDTALATFDDNGKIRPTHRWRQLVMTVEALDIGVYAFDNATDAMAGDLNDIHQVAEFVNMLTGLAIRTNGVAMILHHPNKAGEDWLGSVAWHNKVRSRLIIKDGEDGDADGRVILNPKANYGPQGGRIAFRWWEGAFIRDEDIPDDRREQLTDLIRCNAANAAFLACLRVRVSQGEPRFVGPSAGPNYAPTQFEGMPEAKGLKRDALKPAMERLFAMGAIEVHTYRNTSKGRDVTVLREVREAPRTTPRTTPEHHSRTTPNATPNDPAHTPSPKGGNGAAPKAAAPFNNIDPDCAAFGPEAGR